jgi:hypothetical protein
MIVVEYSGRANILKKILILIINIVTCKRTARQRLNKHPAIHARNNGTTGYATHF